MFSFCNKLLCKSRYVHNLTITSKFHTSTIFIILTQNVRVCLHFSVDQIKYNDMGRAGTAYGEEKSVIQDFGWETGRKRPLVRPTHIWKIILKLIFKNTMGRVN